MRNLLWRAEAFGASNPVQVRSLDLAKRRGGSMKLIMAICIGFSASIMTAVIIGFGIGMVFPLANSSPEFYAAEFAGVVISMTAFYFSVRQCYRRQKRKESQYTERLA